MRNSTLSTPPYQAGEHYGSLDGLRAIAAVGIVMMHVLANMVQKPSSNYLTETIIPYFTNFTFLFMIISAFSVSCGYYERIKNNQITPNSFYKKRYKRILPFFALMVMIDIVWEHNINSLLEGFADLTLAFGLYPNANITVIGVGWFIGLIFLFYMIYPFFVFLIDNKRRAWIALGASVALSLIGIYYFASDSFFEHPMEFGRNNIVYCAPFFVVGGIIYLYRHILTEWVKSHKWLVLTMCTVITIGTFVAIKSIPIYLPTLFLFSIWLIYGLCDKDKVLNNKVVKYLSKISMEIYLCHMLFFRVVCFVHLEKVVKNPDLLYVVTLVCTLIGAIVFSHVCKFYIINKIKWLK